MKQLIRLSVLGFILVLCVPDAVHGQKLGILGDAQFYMKVSQASAPEITRFGSEFSDATTYSLSMAIMINQYLEAGAYLSSETLDEVSGTGTLFGISFYYYPLRTPYTNAFNVGFGASYGIANCNGSEIYAGCADNLVGGEGSLSAIAAYGYVNKILRITPSAELGMRRSSWSIDSNTTDDSGSTWFPFAAIQTSLQISMPHTVGFALTPQYLVSAKARQFEIALAILID